MKILSDDNDVFRMIEAEIDRRILDQMKSKEFCDNSWRDYLNELGKRRNIDYIMRVKIYKEKLAAEMEEILKMREAGYGVVSKQDASR